MTATTAKTGTRDPGGAPARSDVGDPHAAGLDLLCASLEHLYACYRKLIDTSAYTRAAGDGVARRTPRDRETSGGRANGPFNRRLSGSGGAKATAG